MKSRDTIMIGYDHARYCVKEFIKSLLQIMNYRVVNVGTYSRESVDYADYAERVASMVKERRNIKGILACVQELVHRLQQIKYPAFMLH